MYMDIIGIYLFDQNMGMALVKARCTHIPLVLIFLGEIYLSVVKSRSALSPLASCCFYLHHSLMASLRYICISKVCFYAVKVSIMLPTGCTQMNIDYQDCCFLFSQSEKFLTRSKTK